MPTARPRHPITETEDIAKALAAARHAWPELSDKPTALLRKLIFAGEQSISDRRTRRRRAIAATSGLFSGTYGPGYLDELRADWPE